MRESSKQFLDLFFNKNETICVSDCQGGYHSISQEELEGDIRLVSPREEKEDRFITEQDISLVAINPVKGWRRDENTTAYRTFMIECDDMGLSDQVNYVESMKMPYSYACFSGGKSIHFAIVLDRDIPGEHIYRFTYEWILNIMKEADQKTKNPTRCVRFPGFIRRETGKQQALLRISKRISYNDFANWLNRHPDKRPKQLERKVARSYEPNIDGVNKWAKVALAEGVHNMEGSRNQMWMSIGCEWAINGFGLDETIGYLHKYFEEQSDFKEREWLTAIKSGWNYADKIAR